MELEQREQAVVLAGLLGIEAWSDRPPALATVRAGADALRARHGASAIHAGSDDEESPEDFLAWLLAMAVRSYSRCVLALDPGDAETVRTLEGLLAGRPSEDRDHGQLHIDPASSLRRARAVSERLVMSPGPVLLVGDDDATSLGLALLGVEDLHVVDVDPRVLEFLASAGQSLGVSIETRQVDIFEQPVPEHLRHRCSAVITDPFRSREPCLVFLAYGAAALRRDGPGYLYWSDHPDWNADYDTIVRTLPELGLAVVEVREDHHAYPLTAAAFPKLRSVAEALELELEWLTELVGAVQGWSHFHVLERRA